MKRIRMTNIVRAVSLALAGPALLVGVSAPAQAQSAAASAAQAADKRASSIEEVVVTARRKSERLQDVPTAVSALTSKDLVDLKIDNIQAIGQTIPNVYVQKQGGSFAPQIQIRGISNGSLNMQVDTGIGAYVDGVYLGRLGASAFDMADLSQVEIMRGPQGTLFGRNSTGGAINFITAVPTGEFDFHGEMGFGNYNDRRQKVTMNLPAWNGLAARITMGHHENDGYVTNQLASTTFNFSAPFGSKTTGGSAPSNNNDLALLALRYTGVKGLKVDYKYDYSNNVASMAYRQLMNLDPQNPPAGFTQFPVPVAFNFQTSLPSLDTPSAIKVEGQSLVAEYDINDNLTAKYIGGFRKYRMDVGVNEVFGAATWSNGTGGYFAPMFGLRNEAQHQSSHEFQLMGKSAKFDWLLGYFNFEEKASNDNPLMLGALGKTLQAGTIYNVDRNTDYFVGQHEKVDNKSQAVYLHGTWHATEQWDLSGGLRHTSDDRTEYVFTAGRLSIPAFGPYDPNIAGIVNKNFNYKGSNNDYDLSATYKINPGTNVYAKVASGYVSGGTLMGGAFSPEKVKSFEAGVKSDMFNHHLRTNLAVFHMERKNLQVEGFAGTGYVMQNVGEEKSDGIEAEVTYMPLDGLTLNGSYGYTKVKGSGQVRTYQPKQTASFGAQYDFPRLAGGARPTFRVDAAYRDDVYRLNCPAGLSQVKQGCGAPGEVANLALDQQAIMKAQTNLSMRLSLSEIKIDSRTVGRVSIWGRNLLDNDKPEFLFTLGGNTITGIYQQPKTYGVDFAIDY